MTEEIDTMTEEINIKELSVGELQAKKQSLEFSIQPGVDAIKVLEKEIKSRINIKFIFIISPAIDNYLEWAAEEKDTPKAEIVRESIENTMHKDKEYQLFLNQQNDQ